MAAIVKVISEEPEFIVLHKPPNIHSTSIADPTSVASYLLSKYPECAASSPNKNDAGLVNRLDFGTSGILIAARNREYWEYLHSEFKAGRVKKSYIVILEGKLSGKSDVETFIGSQGRAAKSVKNYLRVPKGVRAQHAASTFYPLSYCKENDTTRCKVSTSTGRRHQVRAHAKYLGHPLVGDDQYGSKRVYADLFPDENREFFLHAEEVKFIDKSLKSKIYAFKINN